MLSPKATHEVNNSDKTLRYLILLAFLWKF